MYIKAKLKNIDKYKLLHIKYHKINDFIAFYSVMGTLSHSKIILELFLQNDNSDLLLVIK